MAETKEFYCFLKKQKNKNIKIFKENEKNLYIVL